ncbi:MAG: hypothetical protein DRP10_03165 [Candidatus Aenigmatarchaeota archaeon]|nr:MAG: hypothetical protein DRP10_03165 [Candidatus Aenigmarchaeota archaeon]
MTELFSLLMEGKIIQAIFGVYTGVMGSWFIVLLLLLGFSMVYIKTQNASLLAVLGLMLGVTALFSVVPTQFHNFIFIIMALCTVAILWKLLWK